MISFKSASEIQKYARERERELYSKRMIKLVRCGYSRQLSSTCFLLFLSVLVVFLTTFCSFFHLSSLLFLLASKSATEACLVTFSFCDFEKKEKKKNQTKGISHSRRRHSCDALLRVREPVYSHTHSLHISL